MIGDILQPTHLLFVLIVALLVLGPKRLPEAGKALGQGIRDFRNAMSGEGHDHNTITPPTASTAVAPPPQFEESAAPVVPAATATAPPPPDAPTFDEPAESTEPASQPTERTAEPTEPTPQATEPQADHSESAQTVS